MHPPDDHRHIDRDQLLAHVDLEALLDQLVEPANSRRRWHCPDRGHADEHPSVTVRSGADGIARWRCWSGGHGGTAIDAVVAAHAVTVGDAIRWLAAHRTEQPVVARPAKAPIATVGAPDPAVERFVDQAAQLLWTAAGRPQRDWLLARGLHPEVLRANRVGADPGRRYLPRQRGLPAGWPAVIYPSLSPNGTVMYLQARYLDPPPNRSKYDNPSAHLAANPRLAWTRPIGSADRHVLLVCEGVADALVAAQAGLRSVGVLGAAYPDHRVAEGIVLTHGHHRAANPPAIVVCFDGDDPGRAGADRLIDGLTQHHVDATLLTPPDGLDLTTWAQLNPDWHRELPAAIRQPETPRPDRATSAPAEQLVATPGRSISISDIR